MARIDTLPNFLTDVANAIREKTGDSNLIQAQNFDTEIGSISTGITIQNGIIANYKATSETIPAGTFVTLDNNNYSITDFKTIFGTTTNYNVYDLVNLENDVYLTMYTNGSNKTILSFKFDPTNGFQSYLQPYNVPLTGATDGTSLLFKLNDSTFCSVSTYGAGSYELALYIMKIVNGAINVVATRAITSGAYTNIPRDFRVMKETPDYWYVIGHYDFRYSPQSRLILLKISKSTYSIVSNVTLLTFTNTKTGTSNNWFPSFIHVIDETKFIYYVNGDTSSNSYIYYYEIDWINMVATKTLNTNWNTLEYNYLVMGYAFVNNKHVFLTKLATDSSPGTLRYAIINTSGSSIAVDSTASTGQTIDFTCAGENDRFNSITFSNVGIITGRLLTNADTSIYKMLKFDDNNNLVVTNTHYLFEDKNKSISCMMDVFVMLNATIMFVSGTYVGVFYIDRTNLLLRQDIDDPITISTATSIIQGLTKTECTTSTAGEVYLLDTSS